MEKFDDIKKEVELYGAFIEFHKDRSVHIQAERDGFFQSFDSFASLAEKIENSLKEDKINYFGIHLTKNFYSVRTSKKTGISVYDIETAKELSYLGNPVKLFDNNQGIGVEVLHTSEKGGEISIIKFDSISAKKQKISTEDYTKGFASLGWDIKEINADKKTDTNKETNKKSFLR